VLTVFPQEVVGLRSIRQRLGWLRGLHYRGSLDVVHFHYSLSVQFPTCFPLPASRRDRRGAVGREPSNSTGGTLTRVRASCAGCCAVTMQLTWGARPPRAQWVAPSRHTRCAQTFSLISGHVAVGVRREGAPNCSRGGCAPHAFLLHSYGGRLNSNRVAGQRKRPWGKRGPERNW